MMALFGLTFLLLLGVVGGLETDSMTITSAFIHLVIILPLFALEVHIINILDEKENQTLKQIAAYKERKRCEHIISVANSFYYD